MADFPLELLATTCNALHDARMMELYQQLYSERNALAFTWEISYMHNICSIEIKNSIITIYTAFELRDYHDMDIMRFKDKLMDKKSGEIQFPDMDQGGSSIITRKGITELATYGSAQTSIILPPKCVEELLDVCVLILNNNL